jgi:hypothetical protein
MWINNDDEYPTLCHKTMGFFMKITRWGILEMIISWSYDQIMLLDVLCNIWLNFSTGHPLIVLLQWEDWRSIVPPIARL